MPLLNPKISLPAFALLLCTAAKAQFVATPDQTAQSLLDHLTGLNVTATNATLNCSPTANAVFTYSGSVLPLATGITLCTCEATGIGQPSTAEAVNALPVMSPGDSTLTELVVGMPTKDACVLECDIVTDYNILYLNYSFASEEYPEWNCNIFNDGFGFFITGPEFPTPTNFAKVPGTNIPTAINSINNGTNPNMSTHCSDMGPGSPFTQYYIDNATGTDIVFDGMTTLIEAFAVVNAGTTYHLKFAVANSIDGQYQSGVLMKGSSLSSREGDEASVLTVGENRKTTIYPNPVRDFLSVHISAELGSKMITATVTNVTGQNVFTYSGKGSGLTEYLQTKQISAGLYSMDLRADGYHQVLRFQKL